MIDGQRVLIIANILQVPKMKFFNTLLVSAVVAGSYISNVQACISAKTDLDGRKSPSSSASRTSNVYKSGACINGMQMVDLLLSLDLKTK